MVFEGFARIISTFIPVVLFGTYPFVFNILSREQMDVLNGGHSFLVFSSLWGLTFLYLLFLVTDKEVSLGSFFVHLRDMKRSEGWWGTIVFILMGSIMIFFIGVLISYWMYGTFYLLLQLIGIQNEWIRYLLTTMPLVSILSGASLYFSRFNRRAKT